MSHKPLAVSRGKGKKKLHQKHISNFASDLLHRVYESAVEPSLEAGIHVARVLELLIHKPVGAGASFLDRFESTQEHFHNPSLIYNNLTHQKMRFERNSPEYSNNNDEIIVFLPWHTTIEECERYGFIPKWGRVTAFTTPSGFVNCDPIKTKKIFLDVIKDAKNEIAKILKKSPKKKIHVTAYSAANGAGFYTMNNLLPRENQGNLVSVVTGRGLGEEIFSSSTFENIKRDAMSNGIVSGEEYNKVFYEKGWGKLLPMYNCDKLPNSTMFFIGDEDVFIPPAFGIDMSEKARSANPRINVHRYPFGHVGTMLYAAHLENLKRMQSVEMISSELTEESVDSYQVNFEKRNLIFSREDVRIWASVFTILCRSRELLEESALVKEDTAHRTLKKITSDFLTAILPEAYKTITLPVLKIVSRELRGSKLGTPPGVLKRGASRK